jgi:asparagine synthetase B (glutamine-hydrolysing)
MAKKRRKLNKDFEKKIYSSKKNVELALAKIYDIDDEDIQKEYMSAFNGVVYLYDELKEDYEKQGFNDNSEVLLTKYKNAFNLFESEFEI